MTPQDGFLVVAGGAGASGGPLARLVEAHDRATVVRPCRDALPSPAGFSSVVLAGETALPEPWLEGLWEWVRAGGLLLVLLDADTPVDGPLFGLLGLRARAALPRSEWFVSVAFGSSPAAARLPKEFAVLDRPVPLEPAGSGAVPVLTVRSGLTDEPVVCELRAGDGLVVVSGLGCGDELALLLGRFARGRKCLEERDRPIGFGVLGYGPYGGMGLYHGLGAAATDGLEMIAACDSEPGRRKAAEEEFPGLRPYASVGELAADEDVEVVVVATPPASHFSLAEELLRAGKHVVLEKPMCLRVSEADTLIEQAREGGLVLTVHQSRRWDPDFACLRRAVREGLIGDVFNVETFVGGFEHPCREWHSEVAVSGGAVYDWGSHHLDWILQLMGDFPARLVAHGHKRVWHDVTNLDQVRVRLQWSDGREAEFLQSDVAAIRRPKFYVQGTAGTIAGHYRPLRFETLEPGVGYVGSESHHAEAPVELTLARYEAVGGLAETRLALPPPERYGFHRNLADHLFFGEPLAVTPESGRDVVALLEAATVSTANGGASIEVVRTAA